MRLGIMVASLCAVIGWPASATGAARVVARADLLTEGQGTGTWTGTHRITVSQLGPGDTGKTWLLGGALDRCDQGPDRDYCTVEGIVNGGIQSLTYVCETSDQGYCGGTERARTVAGLLGGAEDEDETGCEPFPCPTLPPPDNPCYDPAPPLHVEPVLGLLPPGSTSAFRPFPLKRVDTRDGRSYLMEEWAVLVLDRQAASGGTRVAAAAASSPDYAAFQQANLLESLQRNGNSSGLSPASWGADRSALLVVHGPSHRHNGRWIPLPEPRLRSPALANGEGRAVLRADFGEDGTLSGLEVAFSERPLTPEEHSFLETNLELTYASEKRHRAVVFVVVGLGGQAVTLEGWETVLPQCCCPGCTEPAI